MAGDQPSGRLHLVGDDSVSPFTKQDLRQMPAQVVGRRSTAATVRSTPKTPPGLAAR